MLLLFPLLFVACSARQNTSLPDDRPGHLISLHYSYGGFRYRNSTFAINRQLDEQGLEKIVFRAEDFTGADIQLEKEIDDAILAELVQIIQEEDILAWDGFAKYNQKVRDGFQFNLQAKFSNRTIKASGYVTTPANFRAGHTRLSGYLLELARSFLEEEP